jgi:putative MATE family efflux protein
MPPVDPAVLDLAEEIPSAPVEHARRGGQDVVHAPHTPGLAPRAQAAGGMGATQAQRGGEPDTRLKSGRLAGLTMGRAVFVLSWPVLCESLLNSTIGLVDTWLSAHISQAATDAVGGAAYLLWFIGLISMAIGVGATALVSRSLGAGKMAVARATLGQAMLLATVGGVGVAVFLGLIAPAMASVLSLRGEAHDDFVAYIRAYLIGIPFSTILFAGTACARGAGDTLRPMITMVVVNIVNLALAWSLAHVLNMGVIGIGLGTACAHGVGAAMILAFHARAASGVALTRRWLRPHRVTAYRLIRLGLPNFLETLGMWFVNFAIILMVGWMSAAAMAKGGGTVSGDSAGLLGAHLWSIRIEAFSYLPGFSMAIAASALVGQYLGAGAPDMARKAALRCAAIASAIMGFMGVVLITLGGPIMHLLSEQPAHREITPKLLAITGFIQIPFAIALVLRSAMHGAGDVKAVMIMTWITQWGLRLPMAYAFSGVDIPLPGGGVFANPFPFHAGLPGLWMALCGELTIRAAIYAARFFHGGWLKARV